MKEHHQLAGVLSHLSADMRDCIRLACLAAVLIYGSRRGKSLIANAPAMVQYTEQGVISSRSDREHGGVSFLIGTPQRIDSVMCCLSGELSIQVYSVLC